MVNLVQGILAECNKCRNLLKQYDEIGAAGVFGKAMISGAIREAEAALGSGDVVRMLATYKALKGCE